MSKHIPDVSLIEHPAIIAIAMDVMFTPSHRAHYSDLVLRLADAALERVKGALVQQEGSENSYPESERSTI